MSCSWSACACGAQNTLSFLPVEEKSLAVRLRWPCPPACRGKGGLVDLVCACDGLSHLPVGEKAVSWTWCMLAMAFSPCLSRKRPSHGLCPHLRWPFPSACRGKGRIVDALASLRLPFPSQGEGKGQFQVSSASPQRGLERTPKVARELPSQKSIKFVYLFLLKSDDLSKVENT